MTYKYEIWFEGGHRWRLACESPPQVFARQYVKAMGEGNTLSLLDEVIINPTKIMYYTYQGEGKW